jgi:hypothetical protein
MDTGGVVEEEVLRWQSARGGVGAAAAAVAGEAAGAPAGLGAAVAEEKDCSGAGEGVLKYDSVEMRVDVDIEGMGLEVP